MSGEPTEGLPRVHARRYVEALREGGSLPAVIETDAGELVVAKWRGAGQGSAALVAEVIAGEIARAVGLPMPSLVTLMLDDTLAITERDGEVRDLLRASQGSNVGMGYLPEALAFDPAANAALDGELAAKIVVFDSFVMNVDRTARNTNLLWSGGKLWLIDHGAALYFHHGWDASLDRPGRAFPLVAAHVLLPYATSIPTVGADLFAAVTDAVLESAVAAIPAEWLPEGDATARRAAYVAFLRARRDAADAIVMEANDAAASV